MIQLSNRELQVAILHPAEDRPRLGSRYCAGGYIWQVYDMQVGSSGEALLSGPCYPEEPPPFHGQGLPESFSYAPGADELDLGENAWIIGVGLVKKTSAVTPFSARHNPEVVRFDSWEIRSGESEVEMQVTHEYREWKVSLSRLVTLAGRRIVSKTVLLNTGKAGVPVRWFAHPFFPVPRDRRVCRFESPVSMDDNPGFVSPDGFEVHMRESHDWATGHFQPLVVDSGAGSAATAASMPLDPPEGDFTSGGVSDEPGSGRLRVTQFHDVLQEIRVETDFRPSFLPIWGNRNTVSFEPYREGILPAGERSEWSMFYSFGEHV